MGAARRRARIRPGDRLDVVFLRQTRKRFACCRIEDGPRQAAGFVSQVYQQDFEPLADRYLLYGDPDTVLARLADYQAAGADTVIFSPACAPERHDEVTALFAREVLPRL